MKPDKPEADFIAILSFLPAEKGERTIPAISGYRPGIKFPFTEMQTSGQQTCIGCDVVCPGETIEAEIRIVSQDYFAGKLVEYMSFDFREGPTIIGSGIIKQILNPILRSSKPTTR